MHTPSPPYIFPFASPAPRPPVRPQSLPPVLLAMHAKRAADLLLQLQKTKWLPPYSDNAVRAVAAEIKELLEPFLEILSTHRDELRSNPSIIAGVVVYYRSIQRNKRCALAYLMNRLWRIIAYRWQVGSATSAHLSQNMSPAEHVFLNRYNKLLAQYCDTVQLNLTADLHPPRDLYVEVRVRRDCGSILTDSGTVALRVGTAHFLKRSDVEHLIRQGALEHIV